MNDSFKSNKYICLNSCASLSNKLSLKWESVWGSHVAPLKYNKKNLSFIHEAFFIFHIARGIKTEFTTGMTRIILASQNKCFGCICSGYISILSLPYSIIWKLHRMHYCGLYLFFFNLSLFLKKKYCNLRKKKYHGNKKKSENQPKR